MRIIISPAKKMNITDVLEYKDLPIYIEETEILKNKIKALNYEEVKKLWKVNDKIATENFERFANMDLKRDLTPAILSYEGLAFKYMAPTVFDVEMLKYIQDNLRVLSGFYGVLKPMDGVTPYRLEMQANLKIYDLSNLYEFWGRKLYDEVIDDSGIIINLASKEYSKIIEKYIDKNDKMIEIVFGENVDGKIKQKGTYAKMARGEMVRFMAENNIENPEKIKAFDRMNFKFDEKLSTENKFVFVR